MHFLQSDAWADFQRGLGREVYIKSGKGWRYMAVLETGKGNKRLYCPYGPVCDDDQSLQVAMASLMDLGKQLGVTFLRVEPTGHISAETLKRIGCKKVAYNQLQPEQTQVITLGTKADDEILADMHPNNRNLYRTYSKKGLNIISSKNPADIEIFLNLIRKVAKRTGLRPHSDGYFRVQAKSLFNSGAAKLFYVKYQDRPIAASIVYDDLSSRYYAHAAADDDFRKLSAGTALVAYMIFDAQKHGKTEFDLYGIAPKSPAEDPKHRWAGFTKFKLGFGGVRRDYIGAWDYPLRRARYHGYKAYQTLNHFRRDRRK